MGIKRITVITCDKCGENIADHDRYYVVETVVVKHKIVGDFSSKEYLCSKCLQNKRA